MSIFEGSGSRGKKTFFLPESGFTLVEVFLVAALMGMILAAIFSTYSSGIKIWRATNAISSDKKMGFALAVERMNRELSGYIRDFDDIFFTGESDNIVFPYVDGNEIVEVTYFFDKGDDTLWRKTVKYTESLKEKKNRDIKRLFRADKVEFTYLFYDKNEENGLWEDSFSEEDGVIPDAIRLDVKQNGGKISEYVFIPK